MQGIVITEHKYKWTDAEIRELKTKSELPDNFLIMAAQEAEKDEQKGIINKWRSAVLGVEGRSRDMKKKLFEYFVATFGAARARYAELVSDPSEVERILAAGAAEARETVAPLMDEVREAVGMR
jgi:tryptophanyl-tRNA synthetase